MRIMLACAILGMTAVSARAADDNRSFLNLTVENDYFADSDEGYTNGLRLSLLRPPGSRPFWAFLGLEHVPLIPKGSPLRYETSLGQSMFTPRVITARRADPLDRPYAGFAYMAFGVMAISPANPGGHRRLDQLELTLGVVGPAALAGETQRNWHSLIAADRPEGWHGQLRNEPAINLGYRHSVRLPLRSAKGISADFTPHLGFAVGTVYDYVSAGATLRIGSDLPGLGVSRIEPAIPGSAYFDRFAKPHFYGFVGFDGRAVARNIFLDGNTFQSGPRVDKKIFVGDFDIGVVAVLKSVRLSYTHAFRTPEFVGQSRRSNFGSINVSVAL